MTTTTGFKNIVTLPQWRSLAPLQQVWSQHPLVCDLRNNIDQHPIHYMLQQSNVLVGYHTKNDGWYFILNPSMAAGPGQGTCGVFCPSQGPNGTLAAGATTTSVVLNTALPATVGVNRLANRGDGQGYKIRIIGLSAGGSGLVEERYIVGNSSGTQPTITLDSALSFTPAATDRYEILSGRVYFLVSNSASGGWKYYDVATSSMSGNLAVANLPSISQDSGIVALDELYVPYTRTPGEGYFGNLVATGSAAASLTGQAAGGDAAVLINEYRNFQIRIVQDVGTPTAVGQRRNITSHTAGASPVYTVAAWTVQPSATATYVIENNTDRILLWTSGQQPTYTYNVASNAWDTTTFATRGAAATYGCAAVHTFGIVDATKNARNSHILAFRGNGDTLDLFDIAGAATGAWTLNIPLTPITPGFQASTSWSTFSLMSSGACAVYCPATEEGRYFYLHNAGTTPQIVNRLDVKTRVVEPWAYLPYSVTTTTTTNPGMHMAQTLFVDGTTKIGFINLIHVQGLVPQLFFQCLITR